MENVELLQNIYKESSMAVFTLEKILKNIGSSKNKIKKVLKEELIEYKIYKSKSTELLNRNDEEPIENGFFIKLGSGMEINMKVSPDDLSTISEILLKGINSGINKISEKINDYKEIAGKEVLDLALKFLDYQTKEKLKLEKLF